MKVKEELLAQKLFLTTNLFLSIFLLYIISRSRNFKYHFSLQEIPLQGITLQEFPLLGVYFQKILCTILNRVIILLHVHGYSLFMGCNLFFLCFSLLGNLIFSTDKSFTLQACLRYTYCYVN